MRKLASSLRGLFVSTLVKLVPLGIAIVQSNQRIRDLAVDALKKAGLDNALESATSTNDLFSNKPIAINHITSIQQPLFESVWSNLQVGIEHINPEKNFSVPIEFGKLFAVGADNINLVSKTEDYSELLSKGAKNFGGVFIVNAKSKSALKALREALNIAISRGLNCASFHSSEVLDKENEASAIYLSSDAVQFFAQRISEEEIGSISSLGMLLKIHGIKPQTHSIDVQKFQDLEGQKQTILIVQPIHGGGLALTSNWLQGELAKSFTVFVLQANLNSFKLYKRVDGELEQVLNLNLETSMTPFEHTSSSFDSYLRHVLLSFEIDHIHVEHLAWQSLTSFKNAKVFAVSVSASIHDFYFACPSYTLLDQDLKPCFGSCTKTVGNCSSSLWPAFELQGLKNNKISSWRKQVAEFIEQCDLVFAPSKFAISQLETVYPGEIKSHKIIEHSISKEPGVQLANVGVSNYKVKVLVLGDVSVNKGALTIKKISERSGSPEIEFHFVGKPWPGLTGIGVHHGAYSSEFEMRSKVRKIAPDLAILPGVVPETFSLVLSEIWAMGIPVLGVAHGAIGERIQRVGGGISLPHDVSADEWARVIKVDFTDLTKTNQFKEKIQNWQRVELESSYSDTAADTYVSSISELIKDKH